ncbi:MAG: hypothetical protein HLX50_13370 [Alteromonadaceae bacterium]|nr:hypothetical protein [Alteromonadaceae bacterium]
MDSDEAIRQAEAILGEKEAQYLKNKLKGGKSNEDGSRYEDNFAVFKLAECIYQVISGEASADLQVSSQVPCFVDDYMIYNPRTNSRESFQLKNSANVSWSASKHPIETDFMFHYLLDKAAGVENSKTILAVSSEQTHRKLADNIPTRISEHTECVHFKDFLYLNQALLDDHELKAVLSKISTIDEADKLSHLHTVMKGVWSDYKGYFSDVGSLIKKIKAIKPQFLRSGEEPLVIDFEVEKILSEIDGFSYRILDNNLIYEYSYGKGTLEGFVDFSSNEAFVEFTTRVLESKPNTFKDLYSLGILL